MHARARDTRATRTHGDLERERERERKRGILPLFYRNRACAMVVLTLPSLWLRARAIRQAGETKE